MIALAERKFITACVESDVRIDGRSRMDMRSVSVELDVVPSASGSCLLKLRGDQTMILAVIKLSVGEESSALVVDNSSSSSPNEDVAFADTDNLSILQGRIRCHVDSVGSGPKIPQKRMEEARVDFTALMDRVMNQKDVVDLKKLSIVPGKLCWIIDLDLTIMQYGGNVVDALFMAARAAMHNMRIPVLEVEDVGAGVFEYDISDKEQFERLNVDDVPVCVTLFKIGDKYVVDAVEEEEMCADARVSVAVDKRGRILAMQKGKNGGVPLSLFTDMVQTAKHTAISILQSQDSLLVE